MIDLKIANKITEIKGLDNLTKLRKLNLMCNNINKIGELDNLTQLQILIITSNKLYLQVNI
jgi:Leucine-rich repeat (LRR) protein